MDGPQMDVTTPPPPPVSTYNVPLSTYYPGLWQQDLYTIPLETLLILCVSQYYTRGNLPVWPFNNESPHKPLKSTTYPSRILFPAMVVGAGATLGGLRYFEGPRFDILTFTLGWVHAALLTELGTATTKVTFQRKRPFYGSEDPNDVMFSDNARHSFVSGHSSHMFSFATYSTLLVSHSVDSLPLKISYGIGVFSLASIVAWSRVTDDKHHISDVILGAALGSATSYFVWERVKKTLAYKASKVKMLSFIKDLNVTFEPLITLSSPEVPGFQVNFDLQI
jgi:membrane-associated phospholipid phosphatase